MKFLLSDIIDLIANALTLLLFARAIISWIPNAHNKFSDFIVKATDPFLNPIRSVVPVVGGVDFSPLVLFFVIQVLRNLLFRFAGV
ncbi:TPA: hypothetical protein DDW69_01315 [candidate division CPR2 bacterium]|nr:MAG: hypothetical protein A2Y27_01940 [candidate division CPR2 bacterium GWD1_39_7]HBG81459.1 hypothetical protein [candidate division CPR2 bacterium]HCL99576.1 hypothetical protein [candidate division CPR2 bacterium]